VHQFLKCASCEENVLVRAQDLDAHLAEYHEKRTGSPPVECLKSRPPDGSPAAVTDSSAAQRPKAEADPLEESSGVLDVNVLELTEGEYAIPDKYNRDPLGTGERQKPCMVFFLKYATPLDLL